MESNNKYAVRVIVRNNATRQVNILTMYYANEEQADEAAREYAKSWSHVVDLIIDGRFARHYEFPRTNC